MADDSMSLTPAGEGVVSLASNHSAKETLDRLTAALQQKGIKVFAVIDHSGEAQTAGLSLRETKLVIFGNPAGGTPLMQAYPTLAIDLPMKALIWQDDAGKVWLSYNDFAYLQKRFGISDALLARISAVENLLRAVAA